MDPVARAREFSRLVCAQIAHEARDREVLHKDLAALAGIHPVTLSHYMKGARILPVDTLGRLAEALAVEPGPLVDRAYRKLVQHYGAAKPSSSSAQVPSRPGHARSPADAQDAADTTTARKGEGKRRG